MLLTTIYIFSSIDVWREFGNAVYSGDSRTPFGLQEALIGGAPGSLSYPFEQQPSQSYAPLQNGTAAYVPATRFYVFNEACNKTADPGTTRNCTDVCGSNDTKTIFSSLETLHNCVVLPNITDTQFQNLTWTNWMLDPRRDDIAGAEALFYRPAVNATTGRIVETLTTCLEDYCDSLGDACTSMLARSNASSPVSRNEVYGSSGSSKYGSRLVHSICASVDQKVLSDIGGIGVYISYFFQIGISLLAFVFSLAWMVLTPYIYISRERKRNSNRPFKEIVQNAVRQSRRHLAIMTVSLIDFQKVQCFFMLATNIAALIVVRRAGLQPNSLQQLYNTYFFLKLIAICGVLPITFTLFNLYLLDILSTYILFLSGVSVFLSIGMYSAVGKFSVSQTDSRYLDSLAKGGGPDSCGNYKLGVYCYTDTFAWQYRSDQGASTDSGEIAGSLLSFSITVYILLVLIKLVTTLRGPLKRCGRSFWKQTLETSVYTRPMTQEVSRQARTMMKLALPYIKSGSSRLGIQAWIRTFLDQGQGYAEKIDQHPKMQKLQIWDAKHMSKLKSGIQRLRDKDTSVAESDGIPTSSSSWSRFYRLTYIIYHTHTGHRFPNRWPQKFLTVSRWLIGLVFFVIYLYFFVIFLIYLAGYAVKGLYNNNWNFGQVVSLSVWFPPIAEFIYLEIRGLRKGSRYRLQAKDYVVVRTPYDLRHTPTDIEAAHARRGDDARSDHLAEKEVIAGEDMDMKIPLTHRGEDCEIVEHKEAQPSITHVHAETSSCASSDMLRSTFHDDWRGIDLETDTHDVSDNWWQLPEPDLSSQAISLDMERDHG